MQVNNRLNSIDQDRIWRGRLIFLEIMCVSFKIAPKDTYNLFDNFFTENISRTFWSFFTSSFEHI